jgi:hypothetical protein
LKIKGQQAHSDIAEVRRPFFGEGLHEPARILLCPAMSPW